MTESDTITALSAAHAWLTRWAVHVGNCQGGLRCTCGLTAITIEAEIAIMKAQEEPGLPAAAIPQGARPRSKQRWSVRPMSENQAAKAEPRKTIPFHGMYGKTVTRITVDYGPLHTMIIGDPESIAAICDHEADIFPHPILSATDVRPGDTDA